MQVKMKREEFSILTKGRKTSFVNSPDLYKLYSGTIMRELLGILGFITGGNNLNNIRYAANAVMIVVKES